MSRDYSEHCRSRQPSCATGFKANMALSCTVISKYLQELTQTLPPSLTHNLNMYMLETLHLSAANIILPSRTISSSLFTQNAGLMSIIHGLASLGSMARNVITILFLFTKSDIKTAIIPMVSVYSDAPWF